MHYKKIRGIDSNVSVICLGSMNWGQQNTEEEAHEQLTYATEQGINFIDTAEMYPIPPEKEKQGTTEKYIGSWLGKRGKRDDLVIASKVAASNLIGTRKFEGERSRYVRKQIREALEGSLERLGTDYLDLYQVHWPERKTNFFGVRNFDFLDETDSTPIEETLSALHELVTEGKIRALGVSNETPWGVNEYLRLSREKELTRISTIQNQYSLTNRSYEIGLSEISIREGVGLLVYSPLSGGVLSGKYLDGAKPEGARFTLFTRNSQRYNNPNVQAAVKKYVSLARDNGLDPSFMALAYCASKPFVTSLIIGTTSVLQVETDIRAGEEVLSQDIVRAIDDIYTEMPDPQA